MRIAGLGIKKHTLDNEASDAFKQYICQQEIQFELVPLGNLKRNQAERAIQTFKAHFIAILAGVDDKFPLSLWCHLLEPTELTLNLLRQSKVVPKISAFAHVHGHHDYMKKPFALSAAQSKPMSNRRIAGHGTQDWMPGLASAH